jgi:hypothetical protein
LRRFVPILLLALGTTIAAGAHGQYDARFVGQSVPAVMTAGQTYGVSITMTNAGLTVWSAAGGPGTRNAYSLGAQNPQDNVTWRVSPFPNRVPVNGWVLPGSSARFAFDVVAPSGAGIYDFRWQMVDDFVTWFGDMSPNVKVVVNAADFAPDATFLSQSVPAQMTGGLRYPVSITLRNSGNTTWENVAGPGTPGAYSLGSQGPQDTPVWRVEPFSTRVPVTGRVAPGSTITFTFDVLAPATPGTYRFQWQMVDDFVTWFGEQTPPVDVVVTASASAPLDAQFVVQDVPTSMVPGEVYPVSITYRNAGTATWTNTTGPGTRGAFSLGSQTPQDNAIWGLRPIRRAFR